MWSSRRAVLVTPPASSRRMHQHVLQGCVYECMCVCVQLPWLPLTNADASSHLPHHYTAMLFMFVWHWSQWFVDSGSCAA